MVNRQHIGAACRAGKNPEAQTCCIRIFKSGAWASAVCKSPRADSGPVPEWETSGTDQWFSNYILWICGRSVENLRVRSLALQKPIHSYFHIALASLGTWATNCCPRAPGGSSGDRDAQGSQKTGLSCGPRSQSTEHRPRSRPLSVLDSYKTVRLKEGLEGERRLKVQRSQKLAVGSPGQAPLSFWRHVRSTEVARPGRNCLEAPGTRQRRFLTAAANAKGGRGAGGYSCPPPLCPSCTWKSPR